MTTPRAGEDFSDIEEAFRDALDESLQPRGPDSLYELLRSLDLSPNGDAIDVGCGEGRDALELARRFGLRVLGIDPAAREIARASAAVAAAGLSQTVELRVATAEALPLRDASVDLVWCKEVLMFADLDRAFAEFARVLRPSGLGFIYQVLTGPLMTDDEARQFWEVDLGYGPARSQRPADMEAAIANAGFDLRQRIDFGGEWGEYAQEHSGAGGRRLVHTARLLREPQRYIDQFGADAYQIMLADCLWHVNRMIGKLYGVAFVFRPRR